MCFKQFDFKNPPEDGLYWVVCRSLEWDVDAGDDGQTVGVPTGEMTQSTVLTWIATNTDGVVEFDAVEPMVYGRVAEDDVVIFYAAVEPPEAPKILDEQK